MSFYSLKCIYSVIHLLSILSFTTGIYFGGDPISGFFFHFTPWLFLQLLVCFAVAVCLSNYSYCCLSYDSLSSQLSILLTSICNGLFLKLYFDRHHNPSYKLFITVMTWISPCYAFTSALFDLFSAYMTVLFEASTSLSHDSPASSSATTTTTVDADTMKTLSDAYTLNLRHFHYYIFVLLVQSLFYFVVTLLIDTYWMLILTRCSIGVITVYKWTAGVIQLLYQCVSCLSMSCQCVKQSIYDRMTTTWHNNNHSDSTNREEHIRLLPKLEVNDNDNYDEENVLPNNNTSNNNNMNNTAHPNYASFQITNLQQTRIHHIHNSHPAPSHVPLVQTHIHTHIRADSSLPSFLDPLITPTSTVATNTNTSTSSTAPPTLVIHDLQLLPSMSLLPVIHPLNTSAINTNDHMSTATTTTTPASTTTTATAASKHINLRISAGESVAVMGFNGGGKTR